jgi:hypothetical protein
MNKGFFGELRRLIFSTLLITIGVILAIVALVAVIDIQCSNDSYYWMPIYPNAELIETQQQGYVRARGMGITEQDYFSTDSVEEIREWYRVYRRQITEGQYADNPDTAIQGIGTNNYMVNAAPDGSGSIISYYTVCGQ